MGFGNWLSNVVSGGKVNAGKEQYKKGTAEAEKQFQSDLMAEKNKEDNRINKTGFIGGQLTGARSIPPEILAEAMRRRGSTAIKHEVVDPSQGAGFAGLRDVVGSGINAGISLGGAYLKGLGMPGVTTQGGAQATTLLPKTTLDLPKTTLEDQM